MKERNKTKYSIDDLIEQIEELKSSRRLLTHQILTLMEVGRKVTTSENLSRQLSYIAKGIVNARLFRRALISIFGRNWERIKVGYAGFSPEEKKLLRKTEPIKQSEWEQICSEKYRLSESYYIPHNNELARKIKGVPALDRNLFASSDSDIMHPEDYLFVPLMSRDNKVIGIISVDEPFDGKKPTKQSGNLRLLELFARWASALIERNIMLNDIRQKEAYLNNIIQSSADVIVSTDENGKIRIFNPEAERVLGYKAEEIIGESVLKLYADKRDAIDVMRKMRSGGGSIKRVPVSVISKDGRYIPLSLSASILYDERGREIGTMGVSHDLTLEKELERKKQEIANHEAISKTVKMLSNCITTQLIPQISLLKMLSTKIEGISKHKQISRLINRILARSCQIAKITKTLESPPAFSKKDEYWDKIKELAIPVPDRIECEYKVPSNLRGVKVLVAEDGDIVRNGIAEFLRDFGMIVDVAEDGEIAIQKIKEKHSKKEMFDIIITDLNMPNKTGMDVFAFAMNINKNIPVILMPQFIDAYEFVLRHACKHFNTIIKLSRHDEGLFCEFCRKIIELGYEEFSRLYDDKLDELGRKLSAVKHDDKILFKEKPYNMIKLLEMIEQNFSPQDDSR